MNQIDLTPHQLDELTRVLERTLAELSADIERAREEASENAGTRRDTGVQDRGEESFAGSVNAVDRALLRQYEVERREVQAALARLRDGGYGDCLQCGGPIGYQRLKVAPAAGRCLRCQERAEEA